MLEKWEKIKNIVKVYNLIPLFFILLSAASINFVGYINKFDSRLFVLLDLTSLSQHILHFMLIYTLAFTLMNLLFFMTLHPLMTLVKYLKPKEIKNNEFFIVRHALTLMAFLFYYIGIEFTGTLLIKLFLVVFISSSIGILINLDKYKKEHEDFDKLTYKKKYYVLFDIIVNFRSANVLMVFVIAFSYYTGMYRAQLVKETSIVYLNNIERENVLFISTSTAVGLYDLETNNVSFVSWDNIENLEFIKKKIL